MHPQKPDVDAYYVDGDVLSGSQDHTFMPSAYGVRHKLPAVTPSGSGFFDRRLKHGMPWVESGLQQTRKDTGCA